MKKVIVISIIGFLMLGLSLTQISIAQPNDSTAQTMESQASLDTEIRLLKLINEAGLTDEQLTQIQDLLSNLREAQQIVPQRQQELKAFLLEWQGEPEEFQAALQPFEDQVQQAQAGLQQAHQAFVTQLKDQLSYHQGETFFRGMHQMTPSASSMPMEMPSGMNMQSMMQGHMQQMMGNQHMDQQRVIENQNTRQHHEGQNNAMPMGTQGMMEMQQMDQSAMMENQNHNQHHQNQDNAMPMGTQGMMGMQQMQNPMNQMNSVTSINREMLWHLDLLEKAINEKLAN